MDALTELMVFRGNTKHFDDSSWLTNPLDPSPHLFCDLNENYTLLSLRFVEEDILASIVAL